MQNESIYGIGEQEPLRKLTCSSLSRPSANQEARKWCPTGRWGSQSLESNFPSELAGRGTDNNVNKSIKVYGVSWAYWSFANEVRHMHQFSRVGVDEGIVPRSFCLILNLHWMREYQWSIVLGNILHRSRVSIMSTIERIFGNRGSVVQRDRRCSRGNLICLMVRIMLNNYRNPRTWCNERRADGNNFIVVVEGNVRHSVRHRDTVLLKKTWVWFH